ncbi:MAG: V-type ATP synthase subunit E family protein [Clostridia bacterium]
MTSGIDRIIEKILEDARIQSENTLARAREEADKTREQLEQRYENRREHEKQRALESAVQSYDRIIANQMLEGRKMNLSARRESVDEAFDKALEKLSAMSEDRYLEVMSGMAVSCLAEGENEIIPSDSGILKDNQRLLEAIRTKAPDRTVVLSDKRVPSKGGILVRNGKVMVNLTFETLIRFSKTGLEAEVVKILFERGK